MAETCGMAVCTSSGVRSKRILQLNVEDKKRYKAKLSLIDGIDPYMLSDRDFSEGTAHHTALKKGGQVTS